MEKGGPKEEREESTDLGKRKTVGSGHPKNRKKRRPVWHKKLAQNKRMNNAWDSSRNAIAAQRKTWKVDKRSGNTEGKETVHG